MFFHRCPRITRIETIRELFRFRAEGDQLSSQVRNSRGEEFELIFASIRTTLSQHGVGRANEALLPSLNTTFHAAHFDKLYELLLGMKTIVDLISQDGKNPIGCTKTTVGHIVSDVDPNATTKDLFSMMTRSEREFVMSLQIDGILTLAEYALRGLLDESYIFSHLPLRLKMPVGEKLKAGIAKVFSLQKAREFLGSLEESLVHSEQNLKECDIVLSLRQYLLDICGYDEDSIHIQMFPTDLQVQHLVSLRMEMKRFFKSTGNFSSAEENVAAWDWAAHNVAFLQKECRAKENGVSEEMDSSVEVAKPNTWGRLWFENCEIKSSYGSNETIVKISSLIAKRAINARGYSVARGTIGAIR